MIVPKEKITMLLVLSGGITDLIEIIGTEVASEESVIDALKNLENTADALAVAAQDQLVELIRRRQLRAAREARNVIEKLEQTTEMLGETGVQDLHGSGGNRTEFQTTQ